METCFRLPRTKELSVFTYEAIHIMPSHWNHSTEQIGLPIFHPLDISSGTEEIAEDRQKIEVSVRQKIEVSVSARVLSSA